MRTRINKIKRLQPNCDFVEVSCTAIVLLQRLPMQGAPFLPIDLGFPDFLVVLTLDFNGNRQPLDTLRSLDLIPIAPVTSRILHIVVENEFVYGGNKVEIPFPGNIVRLNDSYFFHLNNEY